MSAAQLEAFRHWADSRRSPRSGAVRLSRSASAHGLYCFHTCSEVELVIDRILPSSTQRMSGRHERSWTRRQGLQLLELVITMAIAGVLMAGVGSAIAISSKSLDVATTRQSTSTRNTAGFDRLRADLASAYPATSRTATSVTLSVADRNGDAARESIQYRWNGANNPLEMKLNTGSWRGVTDPLTQFEMDWRTCDPQVQSPNPSLEPTNSFVFQAVTRANTLAVGSALSVGIPASYQTNDLLVAAIAVSGNALPMSASAGWTKVTELNKGSHVSLGVWYAFAPSGSSVSLNWTGLASAYGTVAHFRVGSATGTFDSFAQYSGPSSSQQVITPAITAPVDNSLIIRIMAGAGLAAVDEETNMPGHIAITMRRQALLDPIIGMAYRSSVAGSVPAASFALPQQTQYATATVVFRP